MGKRQTTTCLAISKSVLGLLSCLLLHWILLAKGKVMSIIVGGFGWLGKGDSEKTAKLTFYMGKRQTTTCLAISKSVLGLLPYLLLHWILLAEGKVMSII
jgi:hypothetical protein